MIVTFMVSVVVNVKVTVIDWDVTVMVTVIRCLMSL